MNDKYNNYEEKIRLESQYLNVIAKTMKELLKTANTNSRNKKALKTQKKLFDKLNDKRYKKNFYGFYKKYLKKTNLNLKKVYCSFYGSDLSEIMTILKRDGFDLSLISKVNTNIKNNDNLKDIIISLSREYNQTIQNIKMYKDSFEILETQKQQKTESVKSEYKAPELTKEQKEQQRKEEKRKEEQEIINKNSTVLLNGPKSKGLLNFLNGKDTMLKDMQYLYGFSMDMFLIMSIEQYVEIRNPKHGKEAKMCDMDMVFIENQKSKKDMLLKAYGVNDINQLLEKYEKIHKLYYKKFSKLSEEKKSKYDISTFDSYEIKSSLKDYIDINLFSAFKNEKFKFPPSKDNLIQIVNSRIMNGKNYQLVNAKKEEVSTAEPNSYEEYSQAKKYYENLTKNMDVEKISDLYKRVISDIRERSKYFSVSEKEINGFYIVIQKLFCEIILDKKGIKYLDSKQHNQVINEVVNTVLKEELKFSIYGSNKVTEEEKEKREYTVQEEYIRYRAQMTQEGKKDYLSFKQFSEKRYNLTNVVEPKNLDKLIEEEIKGNKK